MKTNVKERANMTLVLADDVMKICKRAGYDANTSCRVLIEQVRFYADYHNVGRKFSLADKVQICADAYNIVCHKLFPNGDDFTKDVYERVQREFNEGGET